MAKSLRSKRRRKMRAAKRVKNAPKELARLKKVLAVKDVIGEEMMDLVEGTITVNIFLAPHFNPWPFKSLMNRSFLWGIEQGNFLKTWPLSLHRTQST